MSTLISIDMIGHAHTGKRKRRICIVPGTVNPFDRWQWAENGTILKVADIFFLPLWLQLWSVYHMKVEIKIHLSAEVEICPKDKK